MKTTRVLFFLLGCAVLFSSFSIVMNTAPLANITYEETSVSLIVLGTVQDAGSPHIACTKKCCEDLFINPDNSRKVVSLGVIDHNNNYSVLIEATPDISEQLKLLKTASPNNTKEIPDAVFLTHAHIGHYTGLMYFGKEATNTKSVPVYVMPKMRTFLTENGPWSQLVDNKNIVLNTIAHNQPTKLNSNITITPLLVPHRDEYSETVGFIISGPNKSALFIPDIDKWEKWERDISEEIKKVDYAFIDATFYDGEEINNRDIAEIPHPFIVESMNKFESLAAKEKNKIYFIHFNHTNPALIDSSEQTLTILKKGFHVARMSNTFKL